MTIRVRTLSAEERAELTRMGRSRPLCAGRGKGAQLVLLAAEGREAGEIGEGLRLHAKTARFWLKRYNAHGLAGLEESERPGRPPVYPADQVGARAGGGGAAGPPAGLPGGPGRGGDRGGADPAGRARPAVRLVDARPPGRLPGRGERDRHAPQPRRRDPAARGAAVAPGGDPVRSAGRSGLRQKKGV